MNNENIFKAVGGWSFGYNYSNLKRSEDEIKQGGNYLLTIPTQYSQIVQLSSLTSALGNSIPNSYISTSIRLITSFVPYISAPFIYLSGHIKQGSYESQAAIWNNNSYQVLNDSLGAVTQLALLQTALVISSSWTVYPALIILGYQIANYFGKVPLPISNFITAYNPINSIVESIYPRAVNYLHEKLQLPLNLSERNVQLATFIAEHTGDVTRVCMIVEAVAIIALGNLYFAIPFFTALAFEALDTSGWVPRGMSLFVEKYGPAVSACGQIFYGTPWGRLQAASKFLFYLSPRVNRLFQQTLTHNIRHYGLEYVRNCWGDLINRLPAGLPPLDQLLLGPELAEVDASVRTNRELTFDQINEILNTPENHLNEHLNTIAEYLTQVFPGLNYIRLPLLISGCIGDNRFYSPQYQINPAHCAEHIGGELLQNRNFDQFTGFFDRINWQRNYRYIKPKLRDDERFLDMLANQFNVERQTVQQNFDAYIQRAAQARIDSRERNQPYGVEAYAAEWLKEQNTLFVQAIKGQRRVPGSQQDLDIAINHSARILAHLNALMADAVGNRIEIEDILLTLSVEAGNYCSRGYRRAASELVNRLPTNDQDTNLTPRARYEMKIKQKLFHLRERLTQQTMNIALQGITTLFPSTPGQDVHVHDLFRRNLSFGFIPIYEYERNDMGIGDIARWNLCGPYQNAMYKMYNPDAIFDDPEMGELEFFNYVREIIETNPNLNQEQKETIIEKYTELNDGAWTFEETKRKFHRLAFVMLGVLKRNEEPAQAPQIQQQEEEQAI